MRASPLLLVLASLVTQSPFSKLPPHPPFQDHTLEVGILLLGKVNGAAFSI